MEEGPQLPQPDTTGHVLPWVGQIWKTAILPRDGHALGNQAAEAVPCLSQLATASQRVPRETCWGIYTLLFHGWPPQGRLCPGAPGPGSCGPSSAAGLCPSSTSHLHRAFHAGEGIALSSLAAYPRTGWALRSRTRKAAPPSSTAGLRGLDRP